MQYASYLQGAENNVAHAFSFTLYNYTVLDYSFFSCKWQDFLAAAQEICQVHNELD